ncbi:MAG TPA: hypothetical protein VGF73_05470 [Chthoniobacterales bacterium]
MPKTEAPTIDRKIIFVCQDRAVVVRDLLDAALFRGELELTWIDLLRLLAAEEKADEQELEYNDDAIDAAAERFRYEHDLITAEETEKWLADRALTLGDFGAYFIRHYWGEQFEEVEAEKLEYLTAPNKLRDLLATELILSGELDRMAQRLSWRLAALSEAGRDAVDPELIAAEETHFFSRIGLNAERLPGWLEQIDRDANWFREMLAMEAIHQRGCAALLSKEARAREIAALRLPLTRFEVETVELDSLDAAREALLCAREDGMSMEEVAAEGRYPYRHPEVLLEEIPEDLQQKFLSVHPGTLLEPIPRGDGFHLCRIVSKAEPNLEDPVVIKRAEERILDRHFADLTTRHIQWRLLLA